MLFLPAGLLIMASEQLNKQMQQCAAWQIEQTSAVSSI